MATISKQIEDQQVQSPALMVIGESIKKAQDLSWIENLPLFGKKVVLCRAKHQLEPMQSRLRALGADCYPLPMVSIEPLTHDLDEMMHSCFQNSGVLLLQVQTP